MIFIKLLFIMSAIIYLLPVNSLASGIDENLAVIQKSYENIQDMSGTFIQKNIIKDLNKADTYSGEFFIKRPLKMKWIYKGKSAQDLIINNNSVIIYNRDDKQAYMSQFSRETFGQTPVALLTGFGNIKDEFIITGSDNSLMLKPRKPMSNINLIKITLTDDDFPIKSFTIYDGSSNVIEIELKNVSINTRLKDSVFDFTPPKGVSIYKQP